MVGATQCKHQWAKSVLMHGFFNQQHSVIQLCGQLWRIRCGS